MKSNPYVHALGATAYIFAVGSLFRFVVATQSKKPDSLADPIGILSLLVFSAALMGFLFFYRPLILLLEHKREEAVSFFLLTLGTFAALTLLVIAVVSML